jgi:hypothetical protein
MRLGLLGPAQGNLDGLGRTAERMLNGAKVTRAVYLGADNALEQVVHVWAESLVGRDPSDEGLWERALVVVAGGSPAQIDAFSRSERARRRLRALEQLPERQLRSAEMVGERLAVVLYDKAKLSEEDIYSATFLIYGKGDAPLIRKIGPRWFLSPGPVGCPGGGGLVLDDTGDELTAAIHDVEGHTTMTEKLGSRQAVKMRVKG